MKKVPTYAIVVLASFSAFACGESPTGPSLLGHDLSSVQATPQSAVQQPSIPAPVDTAEAPTPSPSKSGEAERSYSIRKVTDQDRIQYHVRIDDAGLTPIRFVALTFHSLIAGNARTAENGKKLRIVSGPVSYEAHGKGVTIFEFDRTEFSCGRVQNDVAIIWNDLNEKDLIIGDRIDFKVDCQKLPPTPPPATCKTDSSLCPPPPPPATCETDASLCPPPPPALTLACFLWADHRLVNRDLMFKSSGTLGTSPIIWSIPGGKPADGLGVNIITSFAQPGTYTVKVAQDNRTATCQITIPDEYQPGALY